MKYVQMERNGKKFTQILINICIMGFSRIERKNGRFMQVLKDLVVT